MPKRVLRLWPAEENETRLYLIGCHSGIVKIGRTRRPRGRLDAHRSAFGKDFAWAHLFGPRTGRFEAGLKMDFHKAGLSISKNTNGESFTGITKDAAMSMCRAAITKHLERDREWSAEKARAALEEVAWKAFRAVYMAPVATAEAGR